MESRKRKRGLRASREKLAQALSAAGFKTQSALAQQIAINESLDKPPKDLVSKVFNQKPVSAKNFNRVALALGVQAHEIFLSNDSDEDKYLEDNREQEIKSTKSFESKQQQEIAANVSTSSNKPTISVNNETPRLLDKALVKPLHKRWYSWALTLFAITLVWFISNYFNSENAASSKKTGTKATSAEAANTQITNTKISSALGKVLIVIQAPPELQDLAKEVINLNANNQKISVVMPESPDAYNVDKQTALMRWRAHGVLRFSIEKASFFYGIRAELSSDEHTRVISTLFVRASEIAASKKHIAQSIDNQMLHFIEGKLINSVYVDDKGAFSAYLRAKNLLFVSHKEEDFEAVYAELKSALDIKSQFLQAKAMMCLAKTRQSWMYDSIEVLEEAAEYCESARKIAPEHSNTLMAYSLFLSRSGSLMKAKEQAELMLLPEHSLGIKNADVYAILAEIYLMVLSESNEISEDEQKYGTLKDKMIEYAHSAISLEPSHWRAFNTLGLYSFQQGDIKSAKENFEKGTELVKHEVTMANLGTMQMCFAEFDAAIATYQNLLSSNDNSYIAYENIGTAYMFLQQYDKALANKLTAILEHPEIAIHQVWSAVGEIYRLQGDTDRAYEYYVDALNHVERDNLLETASRADQLHAIYYQAKLQELAPKDYLLTNLRRRVKPFIKDQKNLGLKAKGHLAWLSGKIGDNESKQMIIEQISSICPVYLKSPELL